jgi:hypothetical protein
LANLMEDTMGRKSTTIREKVFHVRRTPFLDKPYTEKIIKRTRS